MVSRSPLRSIGRLVLIVFCLGLVLVLALFVLPIYLDIKAFREPVEEILTALVEAPVTVDGVEINLSLWPTLRLSDIEVEGSGQQDAPIFTHVETAHIRLSLLPFLRKELRIKRLGAENLDFHVHRQEGGAGNWPVLTNFDYDITELSNIEFDHVTIFLDDHDIGQADALIEHLELDIAQNSPLQLELRGALEGLPLSVTMAGPTLADLSPKASSFPVSVDLELSDLQLDLSGSVSRTPTGTRLLLDAQVESDDLAFLRELESIEIPNLGEINLASDISIRDSSFELSGLRGEIGTTSVEGDLLLQTGDDRPRVSGRLSLGHLDLRPWMDQAGDTQADRTAPLPFELLTAVDTEIELKIDRIGGMKHEILNVSTSIGLTDGVLTLPLQLQLADIPLTAKLEVQSDSESPRIIAEAALQDVDLEQLRPLIDLSQNLSGRLDQIRVDAATSGLSPSELHKNLTAQVEVGGTSLILADDSDGRSMELYFGRARVDHRTGQPLTIATSGVLLDEDFQLDIETAPFETLTDTETWPIKIALRGSGATVDLEGDLARQDNGMGLDIAFLAAGDRLAELNAWIGFSAAADLAYQLGGHLTTDKGAVSLRLEESAIGRSRLQGTFSWDTEREDVPLVAALRASALDLQELERVLDPITNLDPEDNEIGFELPILPSGVVFPDANIELTVDRLYRDPFDLTEINASLQFRRGQLERSPFSFQYDASEFSGELELDLRGGVPRFALDLTGSARSLDALLAKEELVSDARLTADRLELSIAAEGATIRQIVESADINGELTDVRWPIYLPESDETLELRLGVLDLYGPKGQPIVLESEGFLDQEPVRLRVTIRGEGEPETSHGLSAPFTFQAEFARTELALDGRLSLPITEREFDLDLSLSGESLSELSFLAHRTLPDLGPYRLEGRLALSDAAIFLQDLHLTLGESDLQGSLEYRQVEGRPTFNAKLLSERTRSADYLPRLDAIASADEEPPAKQRTLSELEEPGFSLDLLNEFDASIGLEINELDTGTGPIEQITSALELDHGQLRALMHRPQPGGDNAQIALDVEPLDRGVDVALDINWSRQRYGLLADILSPGNAEGSWSLDLALQTRGATFEELLQNLGGHIDFTDYPEDFNATILDLWGGGFFGSLMPVFKIGEQSKINCTVGRFVVDQGVMKPELLALDATRSRVRMRGYIDLPNNHIKLRLNPRPKKLSLINLATPVKLRGPLTDPSIRFTTSGIAVTAFRFSLWVYTVWVDILRKPLPTDGSDICLDP